MFEAQAFLKLLMQGEPMTMEELHFDKVKSDLDQVREEVDSLKAKAESYGKSRDSRFFRYLEKIDEKQETVSSRVEAAETSGDAAWGEIRDGLKEAQQRLAIAKLAARSRFH